MTDSTTITRVSYTGDGSSVNFPITFPFYLATDILVQLAGSTVTSGYSISGGNGSTGTLVMATAPAAGVNVQAILNPPLTQSVNLVDGTAFPSSTLNQVNDRAVQIGLRLQDQINRSIRAPDGDSSPLMLLPTATNRANKALMLDSNGNITTGSPNTQVITTDLLAPFINLARTPAEISAGVTPSNYAYATWDVRRMGVVGDGITNDTSALQRCYAVGGDWWVAPGLQINITSTITGVIATHLYSDTSVTPNPGGTAVSQAFLLHNFSGTFFDLVGSPTSQITGSGFGFSRISFVQKNGNGSGASGVCIRAIQLSAIQECPWIRIVDCHFEQGVGTPNDWQYCIQLDGTNQPNPFNLRDCFISGCRFVSGSNATASVLLNGVSNIWITNCEGNLANGNLVITGSDAGHASFSIVTTACAWNAILIDFAIGVYGAGNQTGTFTTTNNSIDVNVGTNVGVTQTLAGTRVSIFGKSAAGKFQIASNNNVRFETGTNPVEIAQVLAVGTAPAASGDVRINNSATIVARNAANSADIPALSVDNSNRVRIAPGGDTICWGRPPNALGGGAGATLGTTGGSGPTTATQFEWLQIFDTSGNACFIPVWK